MKIRTLAVALLTLSTSRALADKGHIWPSPMALAETAQKAILFHAGGEEVLILGVELKAARRAEILEFIPFPAEPKVSLVEGDPFARAQRLISGKKLEIERGRLTKAGPLAPEPVELKLRARMGVHDVAVVEVNEPAAFEAWVRRFFRERGATAELDLAGVLPVAEDYLRRGFRHFVFDRVSVGEELRFAEPLAYRFRSDRIYYPLATSNVVGGEGKVELIMILPGSILVEAAPDVAARLWRSLRTLSSAPQAWAVSSSAKVSPAEAEAVFPGARALFSGTPKIYVQVLEFTGPYRFDGDLLLDPADLRPFADKLRPWDPFGNGREVEPFRGFTEEEIVDYCQARAGDPLCEARAREGRGRPR